MLSLHTNAASLSTQSSLDQTQRALSTAQTRLGTGYRVNSAMDDAAGLQIATRLDAQTRGQAVAMRNTQNGISLAQTAEGAFNEVTSILERMKDLATQAADATSTTADQSAMQSEYDALGKELNNIMKNTSFNGQNILMGSGVSTGTATGKLGTAMTFQIGASSAETMAVDYSTDLNGVDSKIKAATATYDGTTTLGTELTGGTANTEIQNLSDALDAVGTIRSSLGATANRMDHVYNNLQNMSTNTMQAKGRIMDVDYATETSNMTSKQMLMQASTSMLKQSNSMSQMVLSLMQ
jgi:flagellin